MSHERVNILLVDDQPAKLLTYKAILSDLGQNLLTAGNAREALEILLKTEVAIVLVDVYMPDTDGFELAAMIRDHPRFQRTAIIFISAILLNDIDRLRGYEMGGVDYVSVPVIPEVLRAKVAVFLDLYRKTRELEHLNGRLEARVAERTAALTASTRQLHQSEQLRRLAFAAGQMGYWEWDAKAGVLMWDEGHAQIFGTQAGSLVTSPDALATIIHPDDLSRVMETLQHIKSEAATPRTEFRVLRPDGEIRWCVGAAAASFDQTGALLRASGVTVDITERKQSEERQQLLAQEVDHRARNVVAVVQSVMRITRADNIREYIAAIDGRIGALSTAHKLLANSRWEGADLGRLVTEEFAPFQKSRSGSRTHRRTSCAAGARYGADYRTGPARIGDQRSETRRAEQRNRLRIAHLERFAGSDRIRLVRERRAARFPADAPRLWHTHLQCRYRATIKGQGRFPLGAGRTAMPTFEFHAMRNAPLGRRRKADHPASNSPGKKTTLRPSKPYYSWKMSRQFP